MGRAIVREPAVFLMDEPLSNLDAKLRVQMRAEVSRIQRRLGVATMYVTHDQTEAMTMGDRVAVMNAGVLQQCDQPQVLYDHPDNLFVAGFIGSPAMNLYEATAQPRPERAEARLPGARASRRARRHSVPALRAYADKKVVVGMRPEHLALANGDAAAGHTRASTPRWSRRSAPNSSCTSTSTPGACTPPVIDEEAEVGEAVAGIGVARIAPDGHVSDGDRVLLAVRTDLLHLFDPATGVAIRAN